MRLYIKSFILKVLREHWCAYVRVNYQFAIDAVRNSRPQVITFLETVYTSMNTNIIFGTIRISFGFTTII